MHIKHLLFGILLFSSFLSAAEPLKTTVYSFCTRTQEIEGVNKTTSIIVAMESLSEKSCHAYGKKKAEQYIIVGWSCLGKNGEPLYSCESDRAASFAIHNGVKLDNLTFTNLKKHRSLVAYLTPGSNKTCHEDQAELKSAGVKDAICHLINPK